MKTVTRLKVAIVERGMCQREVAEKANVHRSYINMAANNRLILTDDEKTRIANVLQMPVGEIFPQQQCTG